MKKLPHGVKERFGNLPADSITEKLRKDRDRRTDLPARRSGSREARRTAQDETPRPKAAASGASTADEASSSTSTLKQLQNECGHAASETEETLGASHAPAVADLDDRQIYIVILLPRIRGNKITLRCFM